MCVTEEAPSVKLQSGSEWRPETNVSQSALRESPLRSPTGSVSWTFHFRLTTPLPKDQVFNTVEKPLGIIIQMTTSILS